MATQAAKASNSVATTAISQMSSSQLPCQSQSTQTAIKEKIQKGCLYTINGAIVEGIVAPIALVFTFSVSKEREIRKQSSDAWNWTVHKKQFVIDLTLEKVATPSVAHVVGLRDGRVCCYWGNKKDAIQQFLNKLNRSSCRASLNRLDIDSVALHKSCKIAKSTEPFQSFFIHQGEVLLPDWLSHSPISDTVEVNVSTASTPLAMNNRLTETIPKPPRVDSNVFVASAPSLKRGADLCSEDDYRKAKRKKTENEQPLSSGTASTQIFTGNLNEKLARMKALDYSPTDVLRQILQAIKAQFATLSSSTAISALQTKDNSALELAANIREILAIHKSVVLILLKKFGKGEKTEETTKSARNNSRKQGSTPIYLENAGDELRPCIDKSSTDSVYIPPSVVHRNSDEGTLRTPSKYLSGFTPYDLTCSIEPDSGSANSNWSPRNHDGSHSRGGNGDLGEDSLRLRLEWINKQEYLWSPDRCCETLRSYPNPLHSAHCIYKQEGSALIVLLEKTLENKENLQYKSDAIAMGCLQVEPTTTAAKIIEAKSTETRQKTDVNQNKIRELEDRLTQTSARLEEAERLRKAAEDKLKNLRSRTSAKLAEADCLCAAAEDEARRTRQAKKETEAKFEERLAQTSAKLEEALHLRSVAEEESRRSRQTFEERLTHTLSKLNDADRLRNAAEDEARRSRLAKEVVEAELNDFQTQTSAKLEEANRLRKAAEAEFEERLTQASTKLGEALRLCSAAQDEVRQSRQAKEETEAQLQDRLTQSLAKLEEAVGLRITAEEDTRQLRQAKEAAEAKLQDCLTQTSAKLEEAARSRSVAEEEARQSRQALEDRLTQAFAKLDEVLLLRSTAEDETRQLRQAKKAVEDQLQDRLRNTSVKLEEAVRSHSSAEEEVRQLQQVLKATEAEYKDRLSQTSAKLEEAVRLRSAAEGEARQSQQAKKETEAQLVCVLLKKASAEKALKVELRRRMLAEQTMNSLLESITDIETALGPSRPTPIGRLRRAQF